METSRGDAAAATCNIPWRRVAAPPRLRRVTFRGDESRRRRGREDIPWRPVETCEPAGCTCGEWTDGVSPILLSFDGKVYGSEIMPTVAHGARLGDDLRGKQPFGRMNVPTRHPRRRSETPPQNIHTAPA